jgi:ClpP class serine protease
MKRYPAILSSLYNTPHCITIDKFNEIEAMVLARVRGAAPDGQFVKPEPMPAMCIDLDGAELAIDQVPAAQQTRQFVAVLPLFGTIFQHGGLEMEASGGTSSEAYAAELRRLDANPSVRTIINHVHSPGGQVWGTEEASNVMWEIRNRGKTRVITAVNSQMASGALWIGTTASEVWMTPGGEAGSIGVLNVHQDYSKAEEAAGVKTTLVAFPERKVLGHEYAPLDEAARDSLLTGIMATYERFTRAVARNRGVTQAKVEADFGGGGMLRADEAVKAGLADGIATLHEVIQREVGLLKQEGRASRRNAVALAKAAG